MQAQCIFPVGFLPDTLHTQMCLHWQSKEPKERLCPILQCHRGGEAGKPGSSRATLLGLSVCEVTGCQWGLGNAFLQGNGRVNSLRGAQVTPFPASIPPMVPSHS